MTLIKRAKTWAAPDSNTIGASRNPHEPEIEDILDDQIQHAQKLEGEVSALKKKTVGHSYF